MYRHIAMYLCKHVGGWSTTRIGKFYNGRDHSTVVSYAIRRIEAQRLRDLALDTLLCALTEICNQIEVKQPRGGRANEDGSLTQQDVLDILGKYPAVWLTTSDLARMMRVAPSSAWRCCKRLHEAGFLVRKMIGSKPINGVPVFGYQLAEKAL
jgi:hypothetical protein